MKLNVKEFAHYVIGAALLLAAWVPLMNFWQSVFGPQCVGGGLIGCSAPNFGLALAFTAVSWSLWYIIMDQILHKILMKKEISIVR